MSVKLLTGSKTDPGHGESKQEIVHLNGKARGVQCSPRAMLMNDTCHSIELGSASTPLLLGETLLDESMNRLINQVAIRTGGSHGLVSPDSTWSNLDNLSRRRLRFLDRLDRLRLGWWLGWLDLRRWPNLERKR